MLDAQPGSVTELSAVPEARHRRDHPQDLIAQLQVGDFSPCVSDTLFSTLLWYCTKDDDSVAPIVQTIIAHACAGHGVIASQ